MTSLGLKLTVTVGIGAASEVDTHGVREVRATYLDQQFMAGVGVVIPPTVVARRRLLYHGAPIVRRDRVGRGRRIRCRLH